MYKFKNKNKNVDNFNCSQIALSETKYIGKLYNI